MSGLLATLSCVPQCRKVYLFLIYSGGGMSWIKKSERNWLERMFIRTLKCGPIPQHLAVIMDGNRRYARNLNDRPIQGHKRGYDTMNKMFGWCEDLGIKELTVYAFSTENFKRPQEEVNGLMQLFKEKFQDILENKEELSARGMRFQFIGNLSLFSVDIQKLMADLVLQTKDNKKMIFNICMAYTSREEIKMAFQELAHGVHQGLIEVGDINEELFDHCLYTSGSPPPDLLIRTSGEKRLSDFLLWQTSFTILHFTDVVWPQYSIWGLFWAVLFYQHHYHSQQALIRTKEKTCGDRVPEQDCIKRQKTFVANLQRRRMEKLEGMKNQAIHL